MAGEWIKLEAATLEKPEVMRIARLLGVHRDHAVGVLIRFWVWLDKNCVDGRVDGVESVDVDDLMTCPGLSACLKDVGWVQIDDKARTLTVKNFSRHNGETAKKRALKNERQARWRANNVDARVDRKASTREEKRRDTSLRSVGARVTRIPVDWTPSPEDLAFAKERLRADAIGGQVEAFRTYWQGAVKNATSPDWSAKWRTWAMKAARDFGAPAADEPRRAAL